MGIRIEKAFQQDQERPNRLFATEDTGFGSVRFLYSPRLAIAL
jgi:hypothetical protein